MSKRASKCKVTLLRMPRRLQFHQSQSVRRLTHRGENQAEDDTISPGWGLDSEVKSEVTLKTPQEMEGQAACSCPCFGLREKARVQRVRCPAGHRHSSVLTYARASLQPGRWKWRAAHVYPFTRSERINLLELRTIIHTLEWRLRRESYGDCRSLHLTDSQVALAVAVKGRSSSSALDRLLRRSNWQVGYTLS